MSEMYQIVMIQDQGTTLESVWSKSYDNAVDAVKSYLAFVDHGLCVLDREVTLTEPNGKTHTKVFKYPYGSPAEYEDACIKWRVQQFNPLVGVK